jgi:prepilin-type N-terminal cleavage/methylation domain-containing protein
MTRPDRHHAERGMTLIEVLITVLVLTVGLLITLSVFSQMSRATYVAQRKAVLISMAQREMERLRVLPYDQLGLSKAIPAGAPARCRETCANEPLVSGGLVDPGGESFQVQGVSGTIYRYVTWRAQGCPEMNARIAGELSQEWGRSEVEMRAALGDLCPGFEQTKRITVVVSSSEVVRFGGPVRLSTVAADPEGAVLAAGNYDGLQVDARPVVKSVAGESQARPTAVYDAVTAQALNLTDTRCSSNTRNAPGSGHDSHDTGRDGDAAAAGLQTPRCDVGAAPDLITPQAITGAPGDPLPDLSREVTRNAVGGRVLARDDRAGACNQDLIYTAGDADRRKRSVHTWATPAPTANWETPTSAGRATLTFWTQTASAQERPGRLCAVVWRAGTGEILGSTDYQLPTWPASPTQLAISFDLAHALAPAGERLMVTLRTPSDSGADLLLLYDHAGYQSSLSVTTRTGSEMRFPAGAGG